MRNSSRTWLHRENAAFASELKNGSRVLDAGAGNQPYRHLFEHCSYEAADFGSADDSKLTYVCDLSSIPVEDERFDAIVFNQVMEHLPEPLTVLRELNRVLKTNGRMICTAPLFYEEHLEPFDFYRYTQFGWKHLMKNADLDIERLEWMEGYFGTVAYQLETASKYLPKRPDDISPGLKGKLFYIPMMLIRASFNLLARMFYRLDEGHKYTASGYPKNYVVVVRKSDRIAA
jgi:SAM-dependent methyltransferase